MNARYDTPTARIVSDDRPTDSPPSTGYAAVARSNHAPGAYHAEEYRRPPGERDLLADLAAGVTRTVVRPATPDTARREVAL